MERLKGKTILIGKEPTQGRLMIAIAGLGKAAAVGAPGSVPNCVSRCKPAEGVAHAKVTIDANGQMTIANMKSANVTYVNGSEIESKRVTSANSLELGKDRFNCNLPLILETAKNLIPAQPTPPPPAPKVNIRHLETVWDNYDAELERIVKKQQEIGRKRMLPMLIGSFGTIATFFIGKKVTPEGHQSWIEYALPSLVALISCIVIFRNYRTKDTSYEDRKAATEKFTDEYICPNKSCGKFLGSLSYKLLKKQYSMKCPHCKCDFVE